MSSFLDEFQASKTSLSKLTIILVVVVVVYHFMVVLVYDMPISCLFYIKSLNLILNWFAFCTDLESLPNILQKKYALLRDLDKSLQGGPSLLCKLNHRLIIIIKVF